ncbi:hypothetical protein [Clostridium sp. C2-6-12]|uniref:hypothetical protein n=1 Tax=Clostridium sp. C2-6-12 TaxID=2698832 RepID=UPI00136B47D6|nr:hypothetical protein [Clostridium sp. C2-6-12]
MTDEDYLEAVFYNADGQHPVKRYYTLELLYDTQNEESYDIYIKPFNEFLESINVNYGIGCFLGVDFLKSVGVYVDNKEHVPYTIYYPAGADVDIVEQQVLQTALKFKHKFKAIIAHIDLGVLLEKEAHGELTLGRKGKRLIPLDEDVIKPNDISNTASFMMDWLTALNAKNKTVIITDNYLFTSQRDLAYVRDLKVVLKFLGATKINHYGMRSTFNSILFNDVKEDLQRVGTVLEHYDLEDFHDRFWITKETYDGLVFGTSLNGIGKKLCYIDAISNEDAKTVIDYIE